MVDEIKKQIALYEYTLEQLKDSTCRSIVENREWFTARINALRQKLTEAQNDS